MSTALVIGEVLACLAFILGNAATESPWARLALCTAATLSGSSAVLGLTIKLGGLN